MKLIGVIIALLALVGLPLSLWLVPLYRKLSSNEKAIRAKENEMDDVEPDVISRASAFASQPQIDKMVEARKKPLRRELERLKQERQFIIDKLPFFKK